MLPFIEKQCRKKLSSIVYATYSSCSHLSLMIDFINKTLALAFPFFALSNKMFCLKKMLFIGSFIQFAADNNDIHEETRWEEHDSCYNSSCIPEKAVGSDAATGSACQSCRQEKISPEREHPR